MTTQELNEIVYEAATIPGWYTDEELRLLVELVLKACKTATADSLETGAHIVEIGSYKGRSTVAMALALTRCPFNGCVHAIDPHRGIRTGRHDVIHNDGPTLETFRANVRKHDVDPSIDCVVARSTEVHFLFGVHLLHIDALHSYSAIQDDFAHFESILRPLSIVAFHDYEDSFPGVTAFVDNVMLNALNDIYRPIDHVGSLVAFEKKTR